MTIKIPHVSLELTRDGSTKLVVDVRAFEQPILEILHGGPELVLERDVTLPDEEVEHFDPNTEFENLLTRYNGADGNEAVRAIFRNADELAEAVGVETPRKAAREKAKVKQDPKKPA